jgi:hypothetical protein
MFPIVWDVIAKVIYKIGVYSIPSNRVRKSTASSSTRKCSPPTMGLQYSNKCKYLRKKTTPSHQQSQTHRLYYCDVTVDAVYVHPLAE